MNSILDTYTKGKNYNHAPISLQSILFVSFIEERIIEPLEVLIEREQTALERIRGAFEKEQRIVADLQTLAHRAGRDDQDFILKEAERIL